MLYGFTLEILSLMLNNKLPFFFFIIIFIGNSKIVGIPLMISFPVFFYLSNIKVNIEQVYLLVFLTLVFSFYSIQVLPAYDYLYFLWVFNLFFSYFFTCKILIYYRLFSFKMLRVTAKTYLFLFVIFLVGMVFFSTHSESSGRVSFIFGPNMLYRVVIFLSIPIVGYFILNEQYFYSIILIIITVFLVFLTGSRGGLLTLALYFLFIFHGFSRRIRFFSVVPIVVLTIMMFFVYANFNYSSRIFSFGYLFNSEDGYQEAYSRFRPYVFILFEEERFSIIGINYDTFMSLFGSAGYKYPHNILLELVMYYGFFGIFVVVYVVVKSCFLFKALIFNKITPSHVLYYSLLGASIGSLLSGDMGDNGVFLGVLMALKINDLNGKVAYEKS